VQVRFINFVVIGLTARFLSTSLPVLLALKQDSENTRSWVCRRINVWLELFSVFATEVWPKQRAEYCYQQMGLVLFGF